MTLQLEISEVFLDDKKRPKQKKLNTKNISEHQEESYLKPVRVNNFWSDSYIEYESNGDSNKTLSVKEYLNKTKPYLKVIIYNLKKYYT